MLQEGLIRTELVRALRRVLPAFLLVHFTHHLSTGLLVPLMPLLRDYFGLSYFRAGLLISAYSVTSGVANLPMGRLGDWMDKRLLLGLGLIGVSLASIGIGLATGYAQVFLLLLLMGTLAGTYHPMATPLISQHFTPATRGTALGVHFIGGSGSNLITPILAGLLARMASWRAAFVLLALPAILTTFFFWGLVKGPSSGGAVSTSERAPEGLREAARLAGLIALASISLQWVVSAVNSFLPLYFVDKHGIAPTDAAMMVGLVVGAGVLSGPLGGALSDRVGKRPIILFSIIVTGPLLYLLTIVPYGAAFFATLILFGMARTSRMPVMESYIMDVAPPQQRGTVMGIYYFLAHEVGGLFAPVVGLLVDWLGLNPAFTLLALVAASASVVVFLFRRRL